MVHECVPCLLYFLVILKHTVKIYYKMNIFDVTLGTVLIRYDI